jgi:Mn2+/Fe2+ NRAMP family transporter
VVLIVPIAVSIVVLQVWGSYRLIANTFKWLALALLAYVGAALFARPDPAEVLRATFVPTLSLDKTFLSTLVAILGTTISPYLFRLAKRPGDRGRDPDGSRHAAVAPGRD